MFDFRFDKSYGDPQDVRVLALRSLGAITLHWRSQKATTLSPLTFLCEVLDRQLRESPAWERPAGRR